MGKSKKKIDVFSIIVFSVLALSIVMAIVGICVAWTKSTGTVFGQSKTSTATLSDWAEANANTVKLTDKSIEGYQAMAAFAYITLALAALTAIVFVISKFANVKLLKWVLVAVSLLLVVSGILTIALTYSFCGNGSDVNIGGISLASAKTVPAVGAWLLSIFGIVGGATGVAGALKK